MLLWFPESYCILLKRVLDGDVGSTPNIKAGHLLEHFFVSPLLVFETWLLCIALAVLELTLGTKLASNSRDLPASASRMLGLKSFATKPCNKKTFYKYLINIITIHSFCFCPQGTLFPPGITANQHSLSFSSCPPPNPQSQGSISGFLSTGPALSSVLRP